MKLISTFLLMLIPAVVLSQNGKDSSIAAFGFNGTIRVSTIGFAPVPAFSFDKPIVTVLLSLKKRKFSFEPDVAVGVNGRPWIFNNWLLYRLAGSRRADLSAGINISLFFKTEEIASEKDVIRVRRIMSFKTFGSYQLNDYWRMRLSIEYVKGFDTGVLTGYFITLTNFVSSISLSKVLYINLEPEAFYFNFDGNVDGLFGSLKLTVGNTKFPLSVYCQAVGPLSTKFESPGFKSSAGISYRF